MPYTRRLVLPNKTFFLFINIHTHHTPSSGEWATQNRYANFESISEAGYYSIGLHPWYIDTNWPAQFKLLTTCSLQKNVIAIGEAGLDKICKTDWALQQTVFIKQLQLANELKKPIIIHCVKAWDEVLHTLKNENITVPVIFHGFNKNESLAKRITDAGYYLSFGKALQKNTMQQVLATMPLSQLFLETDDANISIALVYKYAAAALSIEMNLLSLQLQKNSVTVFGNTFITL
jgi:TatD DNase family protein